MPRVLGLPSRAGTPDSADAAFRWGILGSGHAARKFVLGLRYAESATAVVVASRTVANARDLADRLSIPAVATGYDEAIADYDVDAFYVATPPAEHCALAMACIEAGKPVLVEKPLAADRTAAEQIVRAAHRRSVFCMEAMWTRFLPLTRRVHRMVAEGDIGEVMLVTGSFGRPASPASDPTLFGGGALLHRGIYPLSLATDLLGSPELVRSQAVLADGIDTDSVVVARHPSGAISVSTASLLTRASNDLVIQGTRGRIHVLAPIYRPSRMTLTGPGPHPRRATPARLEGLREGSLLHGAQQRLGGLRALLARERHPVRANYHGNGYHYEADEVARCVRAGRTESAVMPLAQSVQIAEVLTQARRQWAS